MPHPSAVGCHLLPPEKAYLYPRLFLFSPVGVGAPDDPQRPLSSRPLVFVSTFVLRPCLLLLVAKRHEGTEFHSGGVKEPECARATARQGDRVAVDEE